MNWIWLTVNITWFLKLAWAIFLLFFACTMKRVLMEGGKPWSRCWRTRRLKAELSVGLVRLLGLLEVKRLLLNERLISVPVKKPCWYPKFAWPKFWANTAVPVLMVLDSGEACCSPLRL